MNIWYYFRYMGEFVPYLLFGFLGVVVSIALFWGSFKFNDIRDRYVGIGSPYRPRRWEDVSDAGPGARFFNFLHWVLLLMAVAAVAAGGLSFVYFLIAGLPELSFVLLVVGLVGLVVRFYVVPLVKDLLRGPPKW